MPQEDFGGMDVAWMAVDAIGQLAIFTTAGVGPVPSSAVAFVDTTEPALDSLPETCACELLVNLPRPDDFIGFAKRGFFAYDWSDIHRTARHCIAGYELQARPLRPLMFSDLPAFMQMAAAATRFPDVAFGSSVIPVAALACA